MRLFAGCYEAIREIERDLYELGTEVHPESMQDIVTKGNKDYSTKELQGYYYSITDGRDKDKMLEYMKLPVDYAIQEHNDRTNAGAYPMNPGNSYKLRENVWSQFLHDGKFSYTYNERLNKLRQVQYVIEELERHPNSRQAIIHIHETEDILNMGGKRRVPCSLMYQLMIRNGRLDLYYFQRSGDLLTHLPYDIWLALAFKEYVASRLTVMDGYLHHFVTSLHAYRKDLAARGIF